MSADNIIYIQLRKNKWWVWMGFLSDDDKPKPDKKQDIWFETHIEARAYARGWLRGEIIVEYGILELPPKL